MADFEYPKMTLVETIQLIKSDNLARIKFLEKQNTFFTRLQSLLSVNLGAVILYRFAHWAFCKRLRIISKILYSLNIIIFSCEITPLSIIGRGLNLVHVVGIGIHGKIGDNAVLYGQVTIGGQLAQQSDKGWLGGPIIGNNLTVGFGGKILTSATLGNNIFVGASSLVTKSFPDNSFLFGIPAKVKRKMTEPSDELE